VWKYLIFSWINTHLFDRKFVAFCPEFSGDSYLEFQEKTISGVFFRNFRGNQGLSSTKTCEISPYFLQFLFCVRIALKKFTQVLSYVVCKQVRRHVHKRIPKRRYGEENPGRFVFGKSVFFTLGLGLTTPYSLGVLVLKFYQTFVSVSIEFWIRFEPQIRSTRMTIIFLLITARVERKVCLCQTFWFFSWVHDSSVWPEICHLLSQIQWRFLRGISGKNYFGRNFHIFSRKPSLSSTKTCVISPYFLQFLSCVCIVLKKFTQILSYVVCTQVRRHVHKRITKRRYGEEKPRRFVFRKPVLFTLGLGLTTPYSLGVLA